MSPEIYKDEYSIEILEKSLNYRLFWNVTDKLKPNLKIFLRFLL